MTRTASCLHIVHQWPRDNHFRLYRNLTRHRYHLHKIIKHHHSMPPQGPIEEETEQNLSQKTPILAEYTQQTPKDGKFKMPRSRTGRTSKQKATNGPSSGSNSRHGEPSTQPTHQQQPSRETPSHTTLYRNNRPGSNSIHSTATSTRPSYLNSQWRTHSTQQTPSADTEGLTQALAQLTTRDNSQDTTTPTAGPTKSRWRTAKPRQTTTCTTTTAPTTTKTPSQTADIKPNPRRTTQAATPQHQQRTSQRQRGMTIGFLKLKA